MQRTDKKQDGSLFIFIISTLIIPPFDNESDRSGRVEYLVLLTSTLKSQPSAHREQWRINLWVDRFYLSR